LKVAFLDRDGTIIRDYPDNTWRLVREPELLDGVPEALRYMRSREYEIILLTNQYIIGEGIITLEEYHRFSTRLMEILLENGVNVLDVFYCPHARFQNCDCCKPKTGLLQQALRKYPSINLAQSFFAGDSLADLEFARAAGMRFFGIGLECAHTIRSLNDIKLS